MLLKREGAQRHAVESGALTFRLVSVPSLFGSSCCLVFVLAHFFLIVISFCRRVGDLQLWLPGCVFESDEFSDIRSPRDFVIYQGRNFVIFVSFIADSVYLPLELSSSEGSHCCPIFRLQDQSGCGFCVRRDQQERCVFEEVSVGESKC